MLQASQVVGPLSRRDVINMLGDFTSDWTDVNGGPSNQQAASAMSRLFDGVWKGSYTCNSGFGGGGQTTWTIREVRANRVEVEEQWVRFLTGRNSYAGTINRRTLDVRTEDLGGYSVTLSLSADGSTLQGRYVGHPNQCVAITLRK